MDYKDKIQKKRLAAQLAQQRKDELSKLTNATADSGNQVAAEIARQNAKNRITSQESTKDLAKKEDIDSVINQLKEVQLATLLGNKESKPSIILADSTDLGDRVEALGTKVMQAIETFRSDKSQTEAVTKLASQFQSMLKALEKASKAQSDAVTKAVSEVGKSIDSKDFNPQINVDTPRVEVPPVDNSAITEAINKLEKAFKSNKVEIPKTDLSSLESGIQAVTTAINSLSFPVPNYILPFKDPTTGKATQVVLDSSGNVPITGSISVDTTGLATSAKQDTIIGHVDGIETVLGTIDADTGNIATNQTSGGQKTQIVDAGGEAATVTGGKLDVNATAELAGEALPVSGATEGVAVAIVDGSGNQITSFGGGTQYTEGDTDASITGTAALMEVGSNTLQPVQGTVADGLLVNLGSNNDVTVTGNVAVTNAGLTELAGAIDTEMQVDVVGALPAGTNNIGDVDVASIAAGDNNIGNVDIVSLPNEGQQTMANSISVAVASNQSAIPVDGSGATQPVSHAALTELAAAINSDKVDVNIVSGSSAGVQYTEADTDASITGTAVMWEDGSDTLRAVSAAKPLPVDIQDTTIAVTQSGTWDEVGINDSGNSITVDATNLDIRDLSAASDTVTVHGDVGALDQLDLTNTNPIATAIVDGDGTQITSFGGGTQYTEGDEDATIVGNAMMYEDDDILKVVSTTTPLPVYVDGSASSQVPVNIAAATGLALGAGSVSASTQRVTLVDDVAIPLPTGASTSAKQDTEIGHLATIAGDTTDIETAVELIDDTVQVLGTDTYTEASSKGITLGAVRRDADTTLVNTTNEFTPLQVDANGRLKVEAFSGETLPVSLTSTTVTAISAGDNNIGNVDIVTLPGDVEADIDQIRDQIDLITPDIEEIRVDADAIRVATELIDDAIYVDDTATHATGTSKGVGFMAAAVPTDTSISANDIGMVAMTTDRKLHVAVMDALPAGTAAIGKLAANSGVDIGDVDVTSIAAGTNAIGNVGLIGRTSGGLSIFRSLDIDETEEDIKTSAGQLFSIAAYNRTATPLYLKFYNATAANVTVGSTTPVLTYVVPANADSDGAGFIWNSDIGIAFGTAISVACTTGVADADTGAPGANDCVINCLYM